MIFASVFGCPLAAHTSAAVATACGFIVFHSCPTPLILSNLWVSDSALLELCSRVSRLFWCRSLRVRVHPTQAIWRCFESLPRSAHRLVVTSMFFHEVCSLANSWDFRNRCFSPVEKLPPPTTTMCPRVEHSLRPVVPATSKYRIGPWCNLDLMSVISSRAAPGRQARWLKNEVGSGKPEAKAAT